MLDKPKKPKKNIWKSPSPYGTYSGTPGSPEQWKSNFEQVMSRDEAVVIIGDNSPWKILGLKPGISKEDIKRQFRKLAMQYHPDHNKSPNAAEMFKKIRAAYEILK